MPSPGLLDFVGITQGLTLIYWNSEQAAKMYRLES